MPRIRPYESQVQSPGIIQGRNATGEDFGAGAYAGAAQLGQAAMGLGDVIKRNQDITSVSDTSAKLSSLATKKTIEMKEALRTGTPGDTNFSANILKSYDDEAFKIESEVSTGAARRFFQKHNASMRGEFEKMAYAGQAELAGMKASQDFNTTKNEISNRLRINPTTFNTDSKFLEDYAQKLVMGEDGKPGFWNQEAAQKEVAKAQKQFAQDAILGTAEKNTGYAKLLLKSDQFDKHLDAQDKLRLEGEITQMEKNKEYEAERLQRQQEKALKLEQEKTKNALLPKIAKNEVPISEIWNSNLSPEDKVHYIDLQSRWAKVDADDNSKFWRVYEQIKSNKITRPEELDAYAGHGLSWEGLTRARTELEGRKTPEGKIEGQLKDNFLKVAHREFTKSNDMLGIVDAKGDSNEQAYLAWFLPYYEEQRRQGKTANELLDPKSKDYMGNWFKNFKSEDPLGDLGAPEPSQYPLTPVPGLPAKKPKAVRMDGESLEDFARRTGK